MRDKSTRAKRGARVSESSCSPALDPPVSRSPLSPANRASTFASAAKMSFSFPNSSGGYNTRAKKKLTGHGHTESPDARSGARSISPNAQGGQGGDDSSGMVEQFMTITTRSRAAQQQEAHAAEAASCTSNVGGGAMEAAEDAEMIVEQAEGDAEMTSPCSEEQTVPAQGHADAGEASEPGASQSERPERVKPVVKLTVKLLHTYQEINEKYYAKHRPHLNDGHDDENGDYIIKRGEMINARYEVTNRPGGKSPLLGKGSFGQVVYAIDKAVQPNREVALKIIKNHRHWHEQARCEIELLKKFTRLPKVDSHDWVDFANVVRLLDDFVFCSHCCLVFELLPFTLYDLLKYSRFKGVSLTLVRKFAQNLVRTLDCLRHPSVDVIHCDLKPENVMLVKYNEHRIKVIDFGSSCSSKRQPFTYIQSRFYRAPEVLLCRPYDYAIDMWSLACILVEMHTGQPLFNGKNELQQMFFICDVLGMPPKHMVAGAGPKSKVRAIFKDGSEEETEDYQLVFDGKLRKVPSRNFGRIIRKPMPLQHTAEEAHQYDLFEDLLLKMLAFDPENRLRPAQALKHAFFTTRPIEADRTSRGDGGSENQEGEKRERTKKVDQEVQTREPSFLQSKRGT